MPKVKKKSWTVEGSITGFMILQKPCGEWRNGGEFERPLGQHTAVSIVGPLLGQPGRYYGRHATLLPTSGRRGVLRDDPNNGCEGDYCKYRLSRFVMICN